MELEEKFWSKVDWDIHNEERCWPWLGTKNQKGYGMFKINRETCMAHRVAYELERGPIPEYGPNSVQADHLCLNKGCVNPWHIEIVTCRVNSQRRSGSTNTHCGRGHEMAEENVYTQKGGAAPGRRFCRKCRRINEETRQSKRLEGYLT